MRTEYLTYQGQQYQRKYNSKLSLRWWYDMEGHLQPSVMQSELEKYYLETYKST